MLDFSKFNEFKSEIKGKKILILGLGLQGGGVGSVRFFNEMKCRLRVTDLKSETQLQDSIQKIQKMNVEKYIFGRHNFEDVDWADVVLLNPAVPKNSEIARYAILKNKTIFMEEALFTKLSPVETIGVTGTRGKTTTTTLIHELLKTKFKTRVAGNIPGSETLMLLTQINNENEKVVMELSSFQLFGFHLLKVSPCVSAITNIYEDHLNVYTDMEEYVFDKRAIYLYQNKEDFLIINKNLNYKIRDEAKANIVFFAKEDVLTYARFLKGEHNDENYACALQVAKRFNVSNTEIAKVFAEFKGVAFRQEKIATINGVIYINDTTASTPIAGIKALEAFPKNKIILICGGNSKNCDTRGFAKKIAEKCKYVVFLKGNATNDFRNEILHSGIDANKLSEIFVDFKKAIETARQKSAHGDIILLSPGFTSFGMFANEFERGRQFNEIVGSL